eukprot:2626010-Pyramimonas_sp.AAC.1
MKTLQGSFRGQFTRDLYAGQAACWRQLAITSDLTQENCAPMSAQTTPFSRVAQLGWWDGGDRKNPAEKNPPEENPVKKNPTEENSAEENPAMW